MKQYVYAIDENAFKEYNKGKITFEEAFKTEENLDQHIFNIFEVFARMAYFTGDFSEVANINDFHKAKGYIDENGKAVFEEYVDVKVTDEMKNKSEVYQMAKTMYAPRY